jgi:predicted nucleotidyltransferase
LDEADTQQASAVLDTVSAILGDSVVGAYLHGSAVLGGMRPTSDMDILVVVDRPMTTTQRESLLARMLETSGPGRPKGPAPRAVELTVVVAADVRPWRYPPRCDFQYGEWLRKEFEGGRAPEPADMPDLAPLITIALIGDRPLLGPPPAELLERPPDADLRSAIVAGIPGWLKEIEPDTRNVLLALSRIWCTLATGEIRLKDAAAQWAAERLAGKARKTVMLARDQYRNGTYGDWQPLLADARAAAETMVQQIEAVNR